MAGDDVVEQRAEPMSREQLPPLVRLHTAHVRAVRRAGRRVERRMAADGTGTEAREARLVDEALRLAQRLAQRTQAALLAADGQARSPERPKGRPMAGDDVVEQRAEPLSREQLVKMLAAALLAWLEPGGAHWAPCAPWPSLEAEAILDARELLRTIEENQAALRRW